MFNLVDRFFGGARDFGHRVERQRIEPLFHAEQQRADDGQSQRQAQTESCAPSSDGFDLHRTLQPREHGLHHVEPNSAAGERR